MILENDGGAVCDIKAVKVTDSEILFPETATEQRFQVRARWRVTGKVEHWGHSHWRVNSYRALYTLTSSEDAPSTESWRISEVLIEEQKRETDPGRKSSPAPAAPETKTEPKRESA